MDGARHSLSASTGERPRVRCRSEIPDFSQKQQFLNTVYKKFFQGFCVKMAETHGIVYTPPSIVRDSGLRLAESHRTAVNNLRLLQRN